MSLMSEKADLDLMRKISRLEAGEPLRVVELFAGCGGMSLGLHRAGYHLLGGVEINQKAISTYARNFFNHCDEKTLTLHSEPHDITKFTPQMFMRETLHAEHPENLVDVIVGGPPCQAFSRIGRAKLRAVKKNPQAFLEDERSNLYLSYLAYVDFFRPLAVLIENVPDIMNYGGKNVAEEIARSLEEIGYRCQYTILNAAYYGVPQLRQRFYLLALLDTLDIDPSFPEPTHFIQLPSGYESARSVALKATPGLFSHYVNSPVPCKAQAPAITAGEALEDLPPITAHLHEQVRRGSRSFDTLTPYIKRASLSEYAVKMRTWKGFESNEGVWDHVIRFLPRDYPIFARMRYDDQYPEAYNIALALFQEKLGEYAARTGEQVSEESEVWKNLRKQTVPPYDPTKFPNKWWKLNPDQPSRTLTAHIGKDTYSHIHYDDSQARVISVREAARLQSFPDGFRFTGPMNAAFAQIGNAVPPLQSYALGFHLKQLLLEAAKHRQEIVLF